MPEPVSVRRGFLQGLLGLGGASAAFAAPAPRPAAPSADPRLLPRYARALDHRSLKQSSHDRTGGNADYWPVAAGATREVFAADGPGVVTHIWFTIAAPSVFHLKEIVLRMYWDGNARPSVEVPVGDFFGLNLGQYSVYQSGFLNCSPVKALNSYFAMPFRKSARFTVTNEGAEEVRSYYSNIDYQLVPSLPEDTLYFHAQYRQSAPPVASSTDWKQNSDANQLLNPEGKANHVFFETRGRGHLMGVTLGVIQNQELWMGEGDDMIFIDDEAKPAIVGTGSEDYFCGAWDFGGRDDSIPFAHLWNGAHLIQSAERAGGRYCLYRWHADNPVTFTRYLKHTIEHGHANHRADSLYSVGYWYQSEPYTDFPALPAVAERLPGLKAVGGPGGAKPS
jgi:D-arabinan exo alpha-(1,3)/(1,5)-arabinofuranosidase (non-reducing end)